MVHTVGLLGPNGNVGANVVPHLVKAHQEGKIKFVILTRPGSAVKNLTDKTVEVREADIENAQSLDKAVKGINVLITTIAFQSAIVVNNVVDALSRSPDAVTFIPSRYGARFAAEDFKRIGGLDQVDGMLNSVEQHAQEIGVGVTVVLAGVFEPYFFNMNLVNIDVKNNKVQANAQQLKNAFPTTNLDDLGEALAELASRDPQSIKNKEFSVISHWTTGDQMVEALTKLHGSKPEVTDYDDAATDALVASGPFGGVAAGYKSHWTRGKESFGYKNELKVNGRTFEQSAKAAAGK